MMAGYGSGGDIHTILSEYQKFQLIQQMTGAVRSKPTQHIPFGHNNDRYSDMDVDNFYNFIFNAGYDPYTTNFKFILTIAKRTVKNGKISVCGNTFDVNIYDPLYNNYDNNIKIYVAADIFWKLNNKLIPYFKPRIHLILLNKKISGWRLSCISDFNTYVRPL